MISRADGLIPSPEWERIMSTDPYPVNPLSEKWDALRKDCEGYSCIYCDDCPNGEGWEPPEEDIQTPEYQNHLKEMKAWRDRNPGWIDAYMSCAIKVSNLDGSEDIDPTQNTLENAQSFLDNQGKRFGLGLDNQIGDKHFMDTAIDGAKTLKENDWSSKLLTREQFERLYELTHGFTDDKLPDAPPVRPEGESFDDFMKKGAKALLEEHLDLVSRLL